MEDPTLSATAGGQRSHCSLLMINSLEMSNRPGSRESAAARNDLFVEHWGIKYIVWTSGVHTWKSVLCHRWCCHWWRWNTLWDILLTSTHDWCWNGQSKSTFVNERLSAIFTLCWSFWKEAAGINAVLGSRLPAWVHTHANVSLCVRTI